MRVTACRVSMFLSCAIASASRVYTDHPGEYCEGYADAFHAGNESLSDCRSLCDATSCACYDGKFSPEDGQFSCRLTNQSAKTRFSHHGYTAHVPIAEFSGVNVTVRMGERKGEVPLFFLGSGFTPSTSLLTEAGKVNMLFAEGGGYRIMRVHCMLDLVDIGPGNAYNWTLLDEAFDALVDARMTPIIGLNGNPTGELHELFLSYDFTHTEKLLRWRDVIQTFGSHLVSRYGDATHGWRFEHWNEPMTIDKFCNDREAQPGFGSYQSMFNYYDACVEGLGRADPLLQIGGPTTHSSVTGSADIITKFLDHCDTGTNIFTNKTGTRLDFISIHRKGTYKGAPGGGNATNILVAEREFFDLIREKHPRFADLPFYNDEADPISGWAKQLPWRPGAAYPAFMAKVISQHLDAMDESSPPRIGGVPYALLSNDNSFTGGWMQRTLLTSFNTSDGAYEVVKKPDLTVMNLFERLGADRVHADVLGGSAAQVGAVATVGGSCTAVLLYRSDDTAPTQAAGIDLSLHIEGFEASADLTAAHWRLDDGKHGNPYGTWLAQGSPLWPSREQLAALEAAQEPALLSALPVASAPEVELVLSLPLPAVSLLHLCERPSAPTSAPMAVSVLKKSQGGASVISWAAPTDGAHVVRDYEVHASQGGDFYLVVSGSAGRVAIHRYEKGTGVSAQRCYRVRAVDYWGVTGAFSAPACDEGLERFV